MLLAVAAALAALVFARWAAFEGYEPLVAAAGETGVGLPEDAVVLNAASAESVVQPFAVRADAGSATGTVLALGERRGSEDCSGAARLSFSLPVPGRRHVWARVLWRDACSNSLTFSLGNAPGRVVGQDAVFGLWHWVTVGAFDLPAGEHQLTIREREDGVALDQVLLTADEGFVPTGPALPDAAAAGIRRFADSFARSPGHGLEAWDLVAGKWRIEFTLDPNRIPNQYSLAGEGTAADAAVALVKGPPWKGCRLAFSARASQTGRFGAVLERALDGNRSLTVGFGFGEGGAELSVVDGGIPERVSLGGALRAGQWHRLAIERWAWTLRVFVDDRLVFHRFDVSPRAGLVGLFASGAVTVFDDVAVEAIPWQAEDGGSFRAPWRLSQGARWQRSRKPGKGGLKGSRGEIATAFLGLPVREVLLFPAGAGRCAVTTPGLVEADVGGEVRCFRPDGSAGAGPTAAALAPAEGAVELRKVAVRYGESVADTCRIGPYHFSEPTIEDPADYLDFTAEEYRQIKESPEADKLRRKAKQKQVVGARDEYCVWGIRQGTWAVADGVLVGTGPDATLRFWQEISCGLEARFRVRLTTSASVAEIELHAGADNSVRVQVGSADAQAADPAAPRVRLRVPDDKGWHDVSVRVADTELSTRVDGKNGRRLSIDRGWGGLILLKAPSGCVQFDDMEFNVPRQTPTERFHAFDQRETDWWRVGGPWIDHGGIACAMASSWISLTAAAADGMLWNKRTFGHDLLVAFNVEENTEWFGWQKEPSHVHHPFDNIRLVLSTNGTIEEGYRLEVNSRNRTATVLYRNDVEVASVRQDADFPITHRGGHAPYAPRRNRIKLIKSGSLLKAIINSQEVLAFTDPSPLPVSRVGIGGGKTRINFSRIVVRQLPPPK